MNIVDMIFFHKHKKTPKNHVDIFLNKSRPMSQIKKNIHMNFYQMKKFIKKNSYDYRPNEKIIRCLERATDQSEQG